jgi:hypothetical protein
MAVGTDAGVTANGGVSDTVDTFPLANSNASSSVLMKVLAQTVCMVEWLYPVSRAGLRDL